MKMMLRIIKLIMAVFLHLSKVFGTISHKSLLTKLDRMVIRGTAKKALSLIVLCYPGN